MILYLLNQNCSGYLNVNNSFTFSYKFSTVRECLTFSDWKLHRMLMLKLLSDSMEAHLSGEGFPEKGSREFQDLFLPCEASVTCYQYAVWLRTHTRIWRFFCCYELRLPVSKYFRTKCQLFKLSSVTLL